MVTCASMCSVWSGGASGKRASEQTRLGPNMFSYLGHSSREEERRFVHSTEMEVGGVVENVREQHV